MDFGGHVGTFTFMKTEQHHLETNMRFKKKTQIISKMSGICMFFCFFLNAAFPKANLCCLSVSVASLSGEGKHSHQLSLDC